MEVAGIESVKWSPTLLIFLVCECGYHFERPESDAGRLVECSICGREMLVPKPAALDEILHIPGDFDQPVTSVKALLSVVIGCLFFFACLSGIPAIILGNNALRDIDRSGGRIRGRGLAMTGRILGIFGCLFTLFLLSIPAHRSAREAARRSQCFNNFKQIGLALHNYHMTEGSLPAAAIVDQNGKPLLSWRVAILPYIEQQALFDKFHLDEPWDSPHNLTLLDQMPWTYACPSDPSLKQKLGMTGYQVVVGPETAFTPDFKPWKFDDITDGLSHTLLASESRRTVPWTKPEDLLSRNITQPESGSGSHHGYHNNGFNVLFGDGSVRFLIRTIDPKILNALLTRQGGEKLDEMHH